MSARTALKSMASLLSAAALLGPSAAWAAWEVNMPRGVTPISRSAYDLHMLIFWICVIIGVVVFGVMFYSMWKHRRSKGAVSAQFHEHTALEVVWTVVPFLILVGMAVPATRALIDMEDSSNPDMTVKVTGYQWKWHYDYLDEGVGFFSNMATSRDAINNLAPKGEHYLLEVDEHVVVPVGKKIRFLITASDVIHAWWVPELGMKRDAIPGFVNEMWARIDEPGVYRGQCAELCGVDHGFMPIVVEAVSEADYRQWVAQRQEAKEQDLAAADKQWTLEELMDRGEKAYNANCAACHQPNGQGIPGVFPSLVKTPMMLEDKPGHIKIVMEGRPGTAMPGFAAQLGDVDLAALITYERNAWGNDTGEMVQPSEIKAAR